jgi:hypothetical protein
VDLVWQAIRDAITLTARADAELLHIAGLSLPLLALGVNALRGSRLAVR